MTLRYVEVTNEDLEWDYLCGLEVGSADPLPFSTYQPDRLREEAADPWAVLPLHGGDFVLRVDEQLGAYGARGRGIIQGALAHGCLRVAHHQDDIDIARRRVVAAGVGTENAHLKNFRVVPAQDLAPVLERGDHRFP